MGAYSYKRFLQKVFIEPNSITEVGKLLHILYTPYKEYISKEYIIYGYSSHGQVVGNDGYT